MLSSHTQMKCPIHEVRGRALRMLLGAALGGVAALGGALGAGGAGDATGVLAFAATVVTAAAGKGVEGTAAAAAVAILIGLAAGGSDTGVLGLGRVWELLILSGLGIAVAWLIERRTARPVVDTSPVWRAEFDAVMQAAPLAIVVIDIEGRVEYWSPGAERLLGWSADEVIGRMMPTVAPEQMDQFRANLAAALEGRPLVAPKARRLKKGGVFEAAMWAAAVPETDGPAHRVVAVIADVTEQREIEEFTWFLAQASDVLSSSLDYHTTLSAVAGLVVPRFADWCAIDLLRDDGTLERVSVAHVDPEKVKLAHELMRQYPIDLNEPAGVAQVLRSGKPDFVAHISDEMLRAVTVDDAHLAMMQRLGLRSYIGVPLVARGRTLGAISLVSAESGRVYTGTNVLQAMELARRAALAVDNARLYQASLQEVEERRRAEAQIGESEERFRAVFEQSPMAKQLFALDGTCIAANPAWAELWDSQPQEALGYNILQDPQLEKKGAMEQVRRAFAGEVVHIEPVLYDPAEIGRVGRARYVKASLSPVRDAEGQVWEVLLGLEDVTDRVRAEEALRESEERLRMAAEAGRIGIWEWDIAANRLIWSPQLFELHRVDPTTFGGTVADFQELVHAEDRERVEEAIRLSLETGDPYALEFRAIAGDGRLQWMWTRARVVRDASGEAVRMIGASLDITQRKRAEEAVQAAYERLNAVLTSITDGYIALDNDYRLVAANPSAQRMVFGGRSVEELLGRAFWEVYPEGKTTEFFRQYRAAAERGTDVHFEAQSAVSGRWLETHAYPREWGLEVYVRDITERRKAADDLERQAGELARSNKELQDFAYVASHDLKEPLRGISTCATILQEDHSAEMNAPALEKVATIARLSKRMYGLLDALLEYSSIGRRELHGAPVEAEQLVMEAVDSLRVRIADEGVRIDIQRGLPIITCDRVGVVQVFTNLISNAIKYNQGPEKRVEVGACEREGEQAFYVRDNGIGIAPQHHERVFAMFKRLHRREEFGGGMGAGLAIVKKVVEHHSGRVWVDSEPGRGSTFWFTLGPARARAVRVQVVESARGVLAGAGRDESAI
jgi:PAS domain S-box-containing protein